MGFFSSILPFLTSVGSSLLGGAKTGLQTGVQSAMTDLSSTAMSGLMSKIPGIPSPGGASAGDQAKKYMDAAYPGTNPWEQLGSGGGGSAQIESAKLQTSLQQKMQAKELATRERIANIQADATVQSAATSAGPQAVASALGTRRGAPPAPYETQQTAAVKKLPAELANLAASAKASLASAQNSMASALVSGEEAKIRAASASLASQMARANLNASQSKSVLTTIYGGVQELMGNTQGGPISTAASSVRSRVKAKAPIDVTLKKWLKNFKLGIAKNQAGAELRRRQSFNSAQ